MVTAAEFARAIYGAWRLALLDRKGLDCFDGTVEAYWKSFNAAAIVAPAYALILVIGLSGTDALGGWVAFLAVQTLAYIIDWVAFPLIMIHVCDRIGRFDRYLRYIAVHNWSRVLRVTLLLLVTLLSKGILGGAVLPVLAVTGAILFYQWFIARNALEISGRGAAAIVGLDLIITFAINVASTHFM
jgi:hypothetical protein